MSSITAPRVEDILMSLLDGPSLSSARYVGVDAVEIPTFARQLRAGGAKLAGRWFTDGELAVADGDDDRLAATLAGKEAVAKALGTGVRAPIRWTTIEILRRPDGAPFVVLHAAALERARSLQITEVTVSLCHESTMAFAAALAVRARSGSS